MSNNIAPIQLTIPSQLNFLAPTIFDDLIRLGGNNDGGYIVPKLILKETAFLISMGINDNWTFDAHFLSLNPNLKIHAYDHTISNNTFIKKIVVSVVKLFLGQSNFKEVLRRIILWRSYNNFFTGNVKLFRERIHNRKDNNQDTTIQTIFDRANSNKVFVKMDIEGSEYRVIDDLLKHSAKIVGMVIEFHDTDPLRLIFNNTVRKLQEYYEIAHVHANNYGPVALDGVPEALEITFVRKEFCTHTDKRSNLPIKDLDEPDDPTKADYALTFIF
jgi:FkbM family methyltransferase